MLDGLVSVLFLMHVPHNQDCIAFSVNHILARSIKQHMTKVIAMLPCERPPGHMEMPMG